MCKKVDGLLSRDPSSTTHELIKLMEEFDKRFAKLEKVQQEIECQIDPDELDKYLDEVDAYREKIWHIRRL